MTEITYTPEDEAIITFAKQKIPELLLEDPQMMFCISRAKNRNLVAYEAILKKDGEEFVKTDGKYQLDETRIVDSYWITCEPDYVVANDKKGVDNRRRGMNFLERTVAYGISGSVNEDQVNASMVALPSKSLSIRHAPDGRYYAYGLINGVEAKVTMIYVKSVERTWLPPKVLWVDIYGETEDGTEIIERYLV